MGNYSNSWKKYNLPMPRRECVHPERRIGPGHGMCDDILLLNEVPDLRGAVGSRIQRRFEGLRNKLTKWYLNYGKIYFCVPYSVYGGSHGI